ncbi:acyltransferase family protein [Hymenobacter sp. DG01]|uniref:acyltransferase family protein n=1 Tax=Hymenobacter sp. DG01 TaxID=2584940 RepID=UPI0011241C8F|nr:acyltransferase family protein [Hymenobacter sp. DG01]
MSIEYLNPLTTVAHKLVNLLEARQLVEPSIWATYIINIFDYAALPYAASIVLCVAGVRGVVIRWAGLVLQVIPAVGVLYMIRHWGEPHMEEFVIPSVLYAISTVLFFFQFKLVSRWSNLFQQQLIDLGLISYGLYVIHFPILVLFHQVVAFSGSALTFSIRAVVYLVLALAAAYALDKIFQPWIKKRLSPSPDK